MSVTAFPIKGVQTAVSRGHFSPSCPFSTRHKGLRHVKCSVNICCGCQYSRSYRLFAKCTITCHSAFTVSSPSSILCCYRYITIVICRNKEINNISLRIYKTFHYWATSCLKLLKLMSHADGLACYMRFLIKLTWQTVCTRR